MGLQVLSERNKQQQRRAQLLDARSQGNFLLRLLQEGLLRANYLFTDHTRNALILAVFGFRVSCYLNFSSFVVHDVCVHDVLKTGSMQCHVR